MGAFVKSCGTPGWASFWCTYAQFPSGGISTPVASFALRRPIPPTHLCRSPGQSPLRLRVPHFYLIGVERRRSLLRGRSQKVEGSAAHISYEFAIEEESHPVNSRVGADKNVYLAGEDLTIQRHRVGSVGRCAHQKLSGGSICFAH